MNSKKDAFSDVEVEIKAEDSKGESIDAGFIPKAATEDVEGPAPEKTNKPSIATADILAGLYAATFPVMCPSWEVTSEEMLLMAGTQGEALDLWFPDGFDWLNIELVNKIVVTAAAVAVTVQVLGPRLKKPRKGAAENQPGAEKVVPANSEVDDEYTM